MLAAAAFFVVVGVVFCASTCVENNVDIATVSNKVSPGISKSLLRVVLFCNIINRFFVVKKLKLLAGNVFISGVDMLHSIIKCWYLNFS
ncbi:hypothetical protein D3C73_920270 [compost metagenome]